MKKNDLRKAFFWNTLGNTVNSFNSLFFLIITIRINGIKDAGVFTFCFATTAMLYTIALYYGRTFQVTETDKSISDNEFIVHRFITSFIMIIICLIFCLFRGYTSIKLSVFILLMLFRFLEAISDIYHGILQKNNKLDISGKILLFRSLLNLMTFLVINYIFKNLTLSCVLLVLSNILVLLIVEIPFTKRYKENSKEIKFKSLLNLFKYGFYTFGITFIANYLVNAPRYSIDSMMDEKFQTIFGIVVMPSTIILLANQFVIQPVITILKEKYTNRNKKDFLKIIFKVILVTIFVGIFSIILAYFFGIPVLNFMYKMQLNDYLFNLLIIIVGATLYAISGVFSNALIILRKTKIQLIIYTISCLFAFINSHFLVSKYGLNGATFSYFVTMLMLLIMYVLYFLVVIHKKEIWNCFNIERS